jgi:gliding motility-associated-like protein
VFNLPNLYPLLKSKNLLASCFLLLSCSIAWAQAPSLNWAINYGGSSTDIPYVIAFTSDGGTISAGYTGSKDGQIGFFPGREYWDMWIVKLNGCGTIQWQKSIGGSGYESARDIKQTADGGFIVLGETNSTDGGVVAGYGGTKDIWVLKISATGNIEWQKRYGGSGLDIGNHIVITSDGGYLVAATSSSSDGDIKGNHSTGTYTDGVLMKLSAAGAVEWSKCFGGSKNDELLDVAIINGKIFAAGYANSTDGDIPPSQKNYDVWLLAIDVNGNKIFSKVYGGAQNDVAYSMCVGADESLTLAGYTTSDDGDVKGAKGSQDYWVLNVGQTGNINWQKVLGGTDADYANSILADSDGGYLVGGTSYSSDGDVAGAKGDGDYWLVKLDSKGAMQWQKNYGGSGTDNLHCIIHKLSPDEYYLAGDTDGSGGDFTNGFGDADFGIIKLRNLALANRDTTVCTIDSSIPLTDTLKDVCGFDSVILTYKQVIINSPLYNIPKQDTILSGQSITLPYNGNGLPQWETHQALSCYTCTNPVAAPLVTTTYKVTNALQNGCSVTDYFTVVVLNDALVQTPSAFTPNGDGLNDFFGPSGKVPDGYVMQIFNRYGAPVYSSASLLSKWDGRFKGIPQPAGVYVYIITYPDLQKKQHQQKGTITLIR